MPNRNTIILGTRGSDLALTQARMVDDAIRSAWPDVEVSVAIVKTRGDETTGHSEAIDHKAGRKGLFTGEIEHALRDREIDVAVHSAKDLPSEQAAGLEIGATLPRAAVEDVLITQTGGTVDSLMANATVATGSIRRACQLRAVRRDLHVVNLRGNVPTRLRKLGANNWNGIVLARAGLERLGFDLSSGELFFEDRVYRSELLDLDNFLNAGGQGIIALQVRADDERTKQCVQTINHSATLLCLRAEREFLRLLDGDCDSPVGVLATISNGAMTLRAQLFKPPAVNPISGGVQGPADESKVEELAVRLMEQIDGR